MSWILKKCPFLATLHAVWVDVTTAHSGERIGSHTPHEAVVFCYAFTEIFQPSFLIGIMVFRQGANPQGEDRWVRVLWAGLHHGGFRFGEVRRNSFFECIISFA